MNCWNMLIRMGLVEQLSYKGCLANFGWAKNQLSVGFGGFGKDSTVTAAATAVPFLFSVLF